MGGNLALAAIAALVVASVVGAGALILSISDREDSLRKAEVGLAELGNLGGAFMNHPRNAIDRGGAARSDVAVNRTLIFEARRAARMVASSWSNPTAARIRRRTERTAALSRRAIDLAYAGQIGAGARALAPLGSSATKLMEGAAAARMELGGEIDDVQDDALVGMFTITGAVGVALVGVMLAVSAARRRRARERTEQDALRDSQRRLHTLLRHGSDVVLVVSPDTTVIYAAGALESMLACESADLEGEKLSDWLNPDDVPALLALCGGANGGAPARELRLRTAGGWSRTCEARATSLLNDRLWNGVVLNIWDVSERKQLEELLRHQAFHDDLTGLANRVLFNERLEHALVRGLRSRNTVSVFLIDLDDFKAINDSLGHGEGDRLLREVAERIDSSLRAADTVARLGGDEFGAIIDGSGSVADDEEAARRLVAAVKKPFRVDGRGFPVTASVGIARGVPGESTAEMLVRDADLAMYAAKREEKGKFALYRADMHIATERLQLKADLLHALESGGQLELYYQPVVSLRGKGILGLEALLRWNHPTRGQLLPDEFVPLAEETGAIVPFGRWVLRNACRHGGEWAERYVRGLTVSVNVSARQLQAPELVADVRRALRESRLPPGQLVLEITESELMRDVAQAAEALREIKRLGVRIAIDDFGTGYSSLSQLERLPVDILKVDREFAGTPEDRTEHAQLLRAVTEIGDSLHLSTVAEGIETHEQLEEMRSLDYTFGQGFLFSRPIPAESVAAMLTEGVLKPGHERPEDLSD